MKALLGLVVLAIVVTFTVASLADFVGFAPDFTDGRLIGSALLVIMAAGAIFWWLDKRKPKE